MRSVSPDFFQDLQWRGLVKQTTDPRLAEIISSQSLVVYAGFDPTSDSLHVGSLLPLLTLRRFQLAGHRPIALIGGATGLIGDPSGKSTERQLLTPETLEHNVRGIRRVIEHFLDVSKADGAKVANNADWFKNIGYIDFLRDVGKHFTINHMVAKESVRARLEDREHGISYTEFSYMLLQAYDFHVLHEREGCQLQIGGSDQWGNITAGCELIRRMTAARHGAEAHAHRHDELNIFGMTHPLLMKADGSKFGKSERGNIWLDPDKTSPYHFYQFFMQTDDSDVVTLLKFLSFEPRKRIEELEAMLKNEPEKRAAQTALAEELTQLVHGNDAVALAQKASRALFSEELRELDAKTLDQIFSGAPALEKNKSDLNGALPLIDLLVESGLCASKGAARKDITAGGIYVNNSRVTDAATNLGPQHLIGGGVTVLRKGKRNYFVVRFL